jgi:DNA polymerase-3 subunit delta'
MQDLWALVPGQERAVAQLRRAAERPVHAYLLVGPRGSGVEDAARCFGAALVAPDGDARAVDLVRRGMHPDVVEFEPEGTMYRVKEDIRQRVIPEASRSPIEAARKVVVLYEAERLRGNQAESANALLKTIEEPPPRTVIVLVTSLPDELPDTVRSRCQRVDLVPLADDMLREVLERDGVPADNARLVARLAGGQLGRARALAGPDAPVRDAFVAAATSLDGQAATAVRAVDIVVEAVRVAVAGLDERQQTEAEELGADFARAGYADRAVASLTARLADRHKREHRAARRHALLEGITACETLVRDALAGPDALRRNVDRVVGAIEPNAAAGALDACREARAALARNPSETLLLERLFLHLPVFGRAAT